MSSICRTFKDSNDKLDILREILIIFSINYKKFEGFASVFFCSCNFTSLHFFISNRFIKKAVAQTSSVKKVFLEISQKFRGQSSKISASCKSGTRSSGHETSGPWNSGPGTPLKV